MRESLEIPSAVVRQAELLTGRSAAAALEHLVWKHGQLLADLRAARRQIHQFDQEQIRLDDLEQNLKEIADEIHRRLA